jgi:single-strand DNA-binding protein
MNVVALVGRLTKDPELRYTPNGVATTSFTLAVDDPFAKGEKKADFINIVTWQKTAESAANYLRKGRLCGVEGRISTRNYTNNEGKKIYITEVLASNVRFLEKADNGNKPANNEPSPQYDTSKPLDISDDDLPF